MLKFREEKLLFLSIKIPFSEQAAEQSNRLIKNGIDWQHAIKLALTYDILPIFVKNILTLDNNFIPKSALSAISNRYYKEYTAKNLILWNELKKILDITKGLNMPIIPIKGIVLSVVLYNDIGLRKTSDVDFLVKKEDMARLAPEIVKLGYTSLNESTEEHFHITFEKRNLINTSIVLNAHWDVLRPQKRIKKLINDFWNRAVTQNISGENMLILSFEDLLFESIIELYKDLLSHREFLLKRHLDISQILYYYSDRIDWTQFIKRANTYGIRTLAFYALSLNKKSFSDEILSEETINKLKPSFYKKMIILKVINKMGVLTDISRFQIRILFNFITEVILLSRWGVFFSFLFRWAYPETSLYKNKLHLFYYLVRHSLKIPWLILKQIFKKREKCY